MLEKRGQDVSFRGDHQHSRDHQRATTKLREIADRAMLERGLLINFSEKEMSELSGITQPARCPNGTPNGDVRDLHTLLWCSIDNDDSRDLDQLTVAEKLTNGDVKISVAIADVDALVPKGSALDAHAQHNTTSVYTPDKIFPMLPEKLSTNLTSLNQSEARLAIVAEFAIGDDGSLKSWEVSRALVYNYAKLAYNSVGTWLEGKGPMPLLVKGVVGMAEQLQLQDRVAQTLKELRHEKGALTLETIEPKVQMQDGQIADLHLEEKNRARELIEDFMVTANGVIARFLHEKGFPTFTRVVRKPERWDRIIEVAAERGYRLPADPDPAALEKFLAKEKAEDPLHFPDLSLTVVKLIGHGEYLVQQPGEVPLGHFGLAVRDYSHSTAPNRRYPDLITQRLVKEALEGKPCPYALADLEALARQCTERENDANKVERQLRKSAAALYLSDKVGECFKALVTGASQKGTWVRVLHPPVEGKLVQGEEGLQVGEKVQVRLQHVNVERGFIDFTRVGYG